MDLRRVPVSHLVPEVFSYLHLRGAAGADLHHGEQIVESPVDDRFLDHVVPQVAFRCLIADELPVVRVLVDPVFTGEFLQPREERGGLRRRGVECAGLQHGVFGVHGGLLEQAEYLLDDHGSLSGGRLG